MHDASITILRFAFARSVATSGSGFDAFDPAVCVSVIGVDVGNRINAVADIADDLIFALNDQDCVRMKLDRT